jgi:hypothetical protein
MKAIQNIEIRIMKYSLLLFFSILTISCSRFTRNSSSINEDELYITRRYIGDFIDFKKSSPESFGDPSVVWIKTTRDYSNLSVFSKRCEFTIGDKLFLRRKYAISDGFGYWFYQIENDSSVFYPVKEFTDDDKILVQRWF